MGRSALPGANRHHGRGAKGIRTHLAGGGAARYVRERNVHTLSAVRNVLGTETGCEGHAPELSAATAHSRYKVRAKRASSEPGARLFELPRTKLLTNRSRKHRAGAWKFIQSSNSLV